MVPAILEIKPEGVYMTIGRTEQIVLFQDTGLIVDEAVPKRLAYSSWDTGDNYAPILVMPARLKIEPKSVYVAIGRAKQIVLFHDTFCVVNESVTKWPINGRRHAGDYIVAILIMPSLRKVKPQRLYVAIRGTK